MTAQIAHSELDATQPGESADSLLGWILALALIAAVLVITLLWLERWKIGFSDYTFETAPAYAALRAGHLHDFFGRLPIYGGSLELRAPFAMLPTLWGGSGLAVYRFSALPCLIAAAALAVWLAGRLLARGGGMFAAGMIVLLCVANPLMKSTLAKGHPEELLGATLCVASILLARAARPVWSGLLLGVAVANKQWAVLAVGPVLVALPPGMRLRAMLTAAVPVALLEAPLFLLPGSVLSTAARRTAMAGTGTAFNPQQVWWFIGDPARQIPVPGHSLTSDYRIAPAWLQGTIHPAIALLGAPLTALYLFGRRRLHDPGGAALLLFVLLMLLRCILDPWDVDYYFLPCVLALTAWEVLYRGRLPWLALLMCAVVWLLFSVMPEHLNDTQVAIAFLLATIPAATALAVALYVPRRTRPQEALADSAAATGALLAVATPPA